MRRQIVHDLAVSQTFMDAESLVSSVQFSSAASSLRDCKLLSND